jgi:hypothetical protein
LSDVRFAATTRNTTGSARPNNETANQNEKIQFLMPQPAKTNRIAHSPIAAESKRND